MWVERLAAMSNEELYFTLCEARADVEMYPGPEADAMLVLAEAEDERRAA